MSVALPSSSIAVIGVGFLELTTIGANENPYFAFFNLDAVQGGVFCFTKRTIFRFHKMRKSIALSCYFAFT